MGARPGLPVKAIARHCGLNISTTYHLVRTLAYEGYLVRLPDGAYAIGDSVARRFHDLVSSFQRPPTAATVLRHLCDRAQLSYYLGILKDERVTVVELAEAPRSPYLEDFEVGLDGSAHATALGKALLGALPPRQRDTYLQRHELRPFTPRTHTDPELLQRELATVRAGTPVPEHGEFRQGIACAAALAPRTRPQEPTWAVVIAVRGETVPAHICTEVVLAARDLAGSHSPPSDPQNNHASFG